MLALLAHTRRCEELVSVTWLMTSGRGECRENEQRDRDRQHGEQVSPPVAGQVAQHDGYKFQQRSHDDRMRPLHLSLELKDLSPFGLSRFGSSMSISSTIRRGESSMRHQDDVISSMRIATRLTDSGRSREALALWDRVARSNEAFVEPSRIAWARARILASMGRDQEAERLLAPLDTDST